MYELFNDVWIVVWEARRGWRRRRGSHRGTGARRGYWVFNFPKNFEPWCLCAFV